MSYHFGDWYISSWGWEGGNRVWRIYIQTDSDNWMDDDIVVWEFTGEGRGLDVDWAAQFGLQTIEAYLLLEAAMMMVYAA